MSHIADSTTTGIFVRVRLVLRFHSVRPCPAHIHKALHHYSVEPRRTETVQSHQQLSKFGGNPSCAWGACDPTGCGLGCPREA